MLFCHRVPSPPLDAFVESIWLCRQEPAPRALQRVLPSGAGQLIINLKEDQTREYDPDHGFQCITAAGTILSGARSHYSLIDTAEQEDVAGVAFKPGGAAAFVRVPAHETCDESIPLELLWGPRRTADLRERLLANSSPDATLTTIENALREACIRPGPHPAVALALSAFDQSPHTATIAAVTGMIGLSAKRFIERFKTDVGMTPKRYCRVRRFQRALARAHRGDRVNWAQVALDCGYFDQAHFIHDFRSFAGVTPTGYQAARTPFQNHVKFLQSGDDDL
jgi:AraC-like DNA-binding protein